LTAVPIGDLSSEECRIAPSLERDHVIWIRDERIGFEHDLLGDWSRTRFLISRQHDIVALTAEKAFNPWWHRAIRLYGLRLLERQPGSAEQWCEFIERLSPEGKHCVEADLVLESVAFAANAESLLRLVWERLIEGNATLLTRLLTRFLHVATLPDPRYPGVSDDVSAAALLRIPFWPLWLPMLRVLHEQRAQAIPLATGEITKIADLWLRTTGNDAPLSQQAAQVLLDATSFAIGEIRGGRREREIHSRVFSRLLTAATVYPDEVAELALALVERREESPFARELTAPAPDEEVERVGDDLASHLGLRGPLADPWPDGPLRRVKSEVHNGFLASGDPLQFLLARRPDAAKEVLLALLIREPLPKTPYPFESPIDEFLHVGSERDWNPPVFFHGPFLSFLRINSEKGVEAIVALINFVTDRWMDNRNAPPAAVSATIDGKRVDYFGGSAAYYWYRESAHSPRVVVPALEQWLYLCLEHDKPIKSAVRQILKSSRSTALLGVLAAVGRKHPALFNDDLQVLVPIWRLQVWEDEYKLQHLESLLLGSTMMQWSRWGEAIFNVVRDWHALPHRKTTLGDVLFEQFFTNVEFRAFMNTVHGQWRQELGALGDSDDTAFLEKIILRFDERSWRVRPLDRGVALDFVEPEERTQRLGPIREDNERHMAVLEFPFRCRGLIDRRQTMSEDELRHFWQELRKIGDDADERRKHGDAPEHAILGGIAVLRLLHKSWLDADAERDRWCSEQFARILCQPPPHPELHIAESISNYHWDNFAALLIPTMLADSPSDPGIRSLCGEFALAFNYSVIHDLMSAAFEVRERLGNDFRRLQCLLLISSGDRYVRHITHDGNSIWSCPDIAFDLLGRLTKLLKRFAKSKIPLELPKLVDIAEKSNRAVVEMFRKQHKISSGRRATTEVEKSIAKRIERGRGFEPLHIRAGFSWLEKVDAARNADERMVWIDTIENVLRALLRPLGGIEEALSDEEDDHNFFSFPGEWDTWIFDLIASVVPKLEESEGAYRLWRPILSLGLDRMNWVDQFLSRWFTHGLKVEGCEANFFREWKAMIAYAWTRGNWRDTAVRTHRSDDDLFHHVMGFSRYGHGYFEDAKYRPNVAAMKAEYDNWADEFFPHPDATRAFANFLTFPSAVDHLRDGVRRLAEASSEFEEWHWQDHYHLDSALLKLLEHDWREHSRLIANDTNVREQFARILKTMTDRQIPRAMALQDRMLRAK
jgi:hypothetical protein